MALPSPYVAGASDSSALAGGGSSRTGGFGGGGGLHPAVNAMATSAARRDARTQREDQLCMEGLPMLAWAATPCLADSTQPVHANRSSITWCLRSSGSAPSGG